MFPEPADRITYDKQLIDALDDLNINTTFNPTAKRGSATEDWLPPQGEKQPAGQFFETNLKPYIPATDLFLISLGGNNFTRLATKWATDTSVCADFEFREDSLIEEAFKLLAEKTVEDIKTLTSHIYGRSPNTDIAYILYADYTKNTHWNIHLENKILATIPDPKGASPEVLNALQKCRADLLAKVNEGVRSAAGHVRKKVGGMDLVLIDMQHQTSNMTEKEVTALMFDQLHFSEAGHKLAYETLLKSLGGFDTNQSEDRPEMYFDALNP